MTAPPAGSTERAEAFAALLGESTVPQVVLALDPERARFVAANAAAVALLGRDGLVGTDLAAIAADPDLPADPETWRRLRDGRLDVLVRRRRLRRGDGDVVTVDVMAFALGTVGSGVHLLVALVDPGRMDWSLRRLGHDVEVTAALSDLRAALLGGDSEERLFGRICDSTRAILGADNAGLLRLEGTDRVRLVAVVDPTRNAPGAVWPIVNDEYGRALRESRVAAYTVPDASAAASGLAMGSELQIAMAPVVSGGRTLGSLMAIRTRPFDAEELAVLGVYAGGVSEALTVSEARAEFERLRARAEVARDLHDESIQDLAAIRLSLTSLGSDAPDAQWRDRLDEVGDDVERVTKHLRDLARNLDAEPEASDLGDAVRSLTSRRAGRVGMGWSVVVDDHAVASLAPGVRAEILSVLNEAVSNAVRHSDGTELAVTLVADDAELIVTVTDDGVGPGAASREGGRGLRNLRARAAERAGVCSVEPGPDGVGTRLTWSIPVPG